ncbi:hypothetical protein KBY99_03800 [Cyanobium sp. Maggiore-St4-Cus]|uniref:hypothetical protein n=1 Tax=Cyanobium sp. Maggiore-St4-Cus TaxID=2823717 RepID=UPI0020CF9916|nr:hypothetical protein [Cyanobium sp. Maggiore-St4-Cus]MCP9788102.1 hypothetical protein [Cyanobium sp. Maggiore-St4-Cus]
MDQSWKQLPSRCRVCVSAAGGREAPTTRRHRRPGTSPQVRLIPILRDANLSGLAWHIRSITALAIAFVVVGGLIRLGGLD